LAALLAVSAAGCAANMVAVSKGKKAYVSKGHIFGTKMYYCDATSGTPVCTKVQEIPQGGE